jgi:hypothetical protein
MTTTLTKKPKEVNAGSLLTLKDNIVHAKTNGMWATHDEFSDLESQLNLYSGHECSIAWNGAFWMFNHLVKHINHNAEMLDMVREWLDENAADNDDIAEDSHHLLEKMDAFNTEEK